MKQNSKFHTIDFNGHAPFRAKVQKKILLRDAKTICFTKSTSFLDIIVEYSKTV